MASFEETLQVDVEVAGVASFNLECAVRPRLSKVAAIPEDAVASAMCLFLRTYHNNALSRNVLPAPPRASMNITPP